MDWKQKLARRSANMPRSTVRESLKHAGRPGVISFAGGLPAAELFPVEAVREATERVLTARGEKALQYGQTEGVPELREYLAARFKTRVENVIVTTGGQQALDLLGRVLLDPSDTVVVENPTYLSLLSAWRPLGVVFRGVEIDNEGLEVESLERAVSDRPKALYCMPNFQNPSGVSLNQERREQVARIATGAGVVLVEDDAYGALRFDGAALPPLHELTGGESVYVGTFSKVLAPGFRVGWIVAPADLAEVCARAKQGMDLQTSTFGQWIILELIRSGVLERQLPLLREAYKARRDAMLAALENAMPSGVTWTVPHGGMFLLLRLPPGISGSEFSRAALARDVLVIPGEEFHVSGGQNTLRLNFTNAAPATIRAGIGILAEIASAMLTSPAHHRSARQHAGRNVLAAERSRASQESLRR